MAIIPAIANSACISLCQKEYGQPRLTPKTLWSCTVHSSSDATRIALPTERQAVLRGRGEALVRPNTADSREPREAWYALGPLPNVMGKRTCLSTEALGGVPPFAACRCSDSASPTTCSSFVSVVFSVEGILSLTKVLRASLSILGILGTLPYLRPFPVSSSRFSFLDPDSLGPSTRSPVAAVIRLRSLAAGDTCRAGSATGGRREVSRGPYPTRSLSVQSGSLPAPVRVAQMPRLCRQ